MKFKRVMITPCKNYEAKIYRYSDGVRYPDREYVFDTTLHWHFAYELMYVKRGSMTINKLDSQVELKTDDIYLLNSQEIHSYQINCTDSEIILINSLPKTFIQDIMGNKKSMTFKINKIESKEMITQSMRAISEYTDFEDNLVALRIKALLYNISYYLLRDCLDTTVQYHKGSDSDEFDCVKSAIQFMTQNYKRDITLNEIAKYVGMAPAHFSKYFKDKTSVTFSKFLQRLRLEHAIKDIRENNLTVKAAAESNGFPNVNSFITTCKAEYGHTPNELKIFSSEY